MVLIKQVLATINGGIGNMNTSKVHDPEHRELQRAKRPLQMWLEPDTKKLAAQRGAKNAVPTHVARRVPVGK